MSAGIGVYLKRGLFLVAAGLLAWRMVALGLSEHYRLQADPAAPAKALAWHPANPDALYQRGRQLSAVDPTRAEALLRQAAFANPAGGPVFAALGLLWEQQGQTVKVVELMEIANRLAGKYLPLQQDLAGFWLRQGRLDRALGPLSLVLQARPEWRQAVFPGLLQAAENPQTRAQLAPALAEVPSWWPHFFSYAIAHASNPDTVRALYQLGAALGGQPGDDERRRYLAWLQQQNQWREAYALWSANLTPEQREVLGLNYDGGFEWPLSDEGFGWQAPRAAGVDVATLPTYGARGGRALRVTFHGLRTRFRHLYQYLLLPPGNYELTGLARADNLQAEKGVQWTVSCTSDKGEPKGEPLGASEPFKGVLEWRWFTFTFTAPARDCPAQLLRLELAGQAVLDFEARGSVWFDELAIRRAD